VDCWHGLNHGEIKDGHGRGEIHVIHTVGSG
jgi:hypothetical protein